MIGDMIDVTGYVTQDKFLVGRTMSEIEAILGFHGGRLAHGATFAKLSVLPKVGEFELAALSITAQHRYQLPTGYDISRLKQIAMSVWSLSGPDRLVKVRPVIPHDPSLSDDEQYPPSMEAPQWRLTVPLPGLKTARTRTAADLYRPAF
ncbi:hypothetical protein [Methylorubrum extorquens]|uniref:Uncharacterized protein n=1 Tax=Methylorubrum extorquens TaxID=408 RepID=A0AAX3WAX3_METEX|nr:hypothetical protein [Methylorubrum extorquens]WHQ68592.1 hypothetical protein KEC54_19740 [Methylorubrum extorquens]